MLRVTYFHRSKKNGYSINKVTQSLIREIPNKKEYYVPRSRASLFDIIANLRFVRKNRDRGGINHITGDIHYCILALVGCKSVLTVHDTVLVDYLPGSWLKKKIFEWLWYRIPLKLATKVVCISESTRKSLSRYTDRKDMVVVHNAIDPTFRKEEPPHNTVPRILIIGTNPNKNVERTLRALSGTPCHVTIIGKLSRDQEALLADLKIDYSCKSDLTDGQIVEEYAACDIVSFVSLFEGFGMPVIEANAVGRPIVCSSIEVLREIAGDAALFVNPHSVEDIRNSFSRLIHDSDLQKDLVRKGFENIRRFDPREQGARLLSVYESVQ